LVPASALFIAAQVLALSVYVALAAYVVSSRGSRLVNLPFSAFCVTQAFAAFGSLVLNFPTAPASVPELLKLRAAVALLAPPLFLHVAFIPLRGTRSRLGQALVVAAFAIGGSGAVLAGFTNRLFAGSVVRGLPGAYILTPILSPTGYAMVVLWLASIFAALVALLVCILWRAGSRRSISDARLLLAPCLLLILSLCSRAVLVSLPPAAPATVFVYLALAERCLSLLAGLLLANNVLRYGSPAGQPIHYGLGPLVLATSLAVLVDIGLLVYPGHTADRAYLMAPVLTGLVAGVLLARPEVLRLTDRWLGRQPPMESAFAARIRAAWQGLAADSAGPLRVQDLARALQSEISAAYVWVLERTAPPPAKPGSLVFGGGDGGPVVHFQSPDLDWPITPASVRDASMRAEGLPGSASFILPISIESDIVGILAIGEPERGGVYARGEIMRAELLVDLLSAAFSAKIPLVERSPSPPDHPPRDGAPGATLTIRAFGRLEVISPPNSLGRTPPISLRGRQVLASLVTAYPGPVSAETLMERLWPEATPASASNNLHVAIYALRRALEPGLPKGGASRYVPREGDSYRLFLDDSIWVDTQAFEAAYRRGQPNAQAYDPGLAAIEFQKALAHYRGSFLDEATLNPSPEVEVVRHRLRHHAQEMARSVVRHLGEQGRWREAKALVLALREADPWDETFGELLAQVDASLR